MRVGGPGSAWGSGYSGGLVYMHDAVFNHMGRSFSGIGSHMGARGPGRARLDRGPPPSLDTGHVLTDPEASMTWEEGAILLGEVSVLAGWHRAAPGSAELAESGFHGGGGPLTLTPREPWEKRVWSPGFESYM